MRECKHFHAPGVLHEPCKDCLIEQQAARIEELESKLAESEAWVWKKESVNKELEAENARLKTVPMKYRRMEFNAKLQQRIKELEAQLSAVAEEGALRGLKLAALHKRIDDAPVVAWMSPGKERLEFSLPSTVYGSHTIPLISKEDLK